MKKSLVVIAALLALAGVAMATPMIDAHIFYPDATSWQLYVQEVDSAAPTTPSGLGLAAFAITVRGGLIGAGNSWLDGEWANNQAVKAGTITKGTLGFQVPGSTQIFDDGTGVGYVQTNGSIDTANWANLMTYGFGVTDGQYKPGTANIPYSGYTPTSTWKVGGVTGASYNYTAPGNISWSDVDGAYDGPAMSFTGVCIWGGLRAEGANVWVDTNPTVSSANVFMDMPTGTPGVAYLTPEPATMGLLLIGAVAALRRRRA